MIFIVFVTILTNYCGLVTKGFPGMQYAPFEWCVHLVVFSDLPSPAQSVSATVERAILAMKFINGRLCYQRKS